MNPDLTRGFKRFWEGIRAGLSVPDAAAGSPATTFLRPAECCPAVPQGRHAVLLDAYRSLAALRRSLPDLTDPDMRRTSCEYDEGVRWFTISRGEVVVAVLLPRD